ncbi:unnamed protein product [Linum tenue]|uniref:Uncharacterized protein n=1 Tax=Linum tenue TaxID=586396 RepID=A0AAV0Q0J5_9ROSI|nr:unnamed protein product [Linum tenue]CAI0476740.1 unnamed protein product [Linum tenue]
MGSNSKRSSGPVLRSLSPQGRFPSYNSVSHLSSSSSSSAFASSTSSSFYSPPSTTQIRLFDARQSIFPESFIAEVPILDRADPHLPIATYMSRRSTPITSPASPRGRRVCALRPRIPDRSVAVSTRTATITPTPEGTRSCRTG